MERLLHPNRRISTIFIHFTSYTRFGVASNDRRSGALSESRAARFQSGHAAGAARPEDAGSSCLWIAAMDESLMRAELERLHCQCFGWAMSCCRRDSARAEDVLQRVYVKVLEGKARYAGEGAFKTWLFAVIRMTARDEYRKDGLR